MPELLVEVTRGDRVESSHYGNIAVVDLQGNLVARVGDPEIWVCLRSMAKPIQALPVITTGAAQAFGFGDEELALFSGSLNGQDFQVALVEKVLARLGSDRRQSALRRARPLAPAHGPGPGQGRPVAHNPPQQLRRQTRGHAGPVRPPRLAGGRLSGYPTPGAAAYPADDCRGYRSPGRPRLPWPSTAAGRRYFMFPWLALPWPTPNSPPRPKGRCRPATLTDAMATLARACLANPRLIAGDGRLCTDIMQALPGRVLAKTGAEGGYALALIDEGLGAAIKVSDGHARGLNPTAIETLAQLNCSHG